MVGGVRSPYLDYYVAVLHSCLQELELFPRTIQSAKVKEIRLALTTQTYLHCMTLFHIGYCLKNLCLLVHSPATN